jgi:hypothetical protein
LFQRRRDGELLKSQIGGGNMVRAAAEPTHYAREMGPGSPLDQGSIAGQIDGTRNVAGLEADVVVRLVGECAYPQAEVSALEAEPE